MRPSGETATSMATADERPTAPTVPPPYLCWRRPQAPSSSPRGAGPAASQSSRTSPPPSCARLGTTKGKGGGQLSLGTAHDRECGSILVDPKGNDSSIPFSRNTKAINGGSPMSLSHTLPYVAWNRDRPRGPALGCGGRNRPETDPGCRSPLFSHSLTPAPPSDHDGTVTHRESRLDHLT